MRLLFIGLCLMTITLVSCRQQVPSAAETGIQITMSLDPETPTVGDAILHITVTDADGNPIDDATINVRGDMSHAGMTPVIRQVAMGSGGEYEIPFEWTMAGDWFIEVTVTLPDGTSATETFEYDGVQEAP